MKDVRRVCDRCGVMIQNLEGTSMSLPAYGDKGFDLCPECYDAMREWAWGFTAVAP